MDPKQGNNAVVDQLCPTCGLCCNGVLFGDVELQAEDDHKGLAALGLRLHRKRKTLFLSQPCSCFDGKLCRIYTDRPVRCRKFNCRLVQDVQKGDRAVTDALTSIERARRHVKLVRALLESLGERDDTLPLSRRCAKIISQPIDLTVNQEQIELRAQLMRAIHKLTFELERNFLT
jgi:uncharacterized protein